MMMGSFHPSTSRGIRGITMGSRKTVPPKAFLMVPFGDSHTARQSVQAMRQLVARLLTLLQVEFLHAGLVWGDGGALHAHRVLLDCLGGIERDLVIGLVSVGQAQVVVLEVDVEVRVDELVLDVLPDDPGHLVAVQLHDGVLHLDLGTDGGTHLPGLREGWAEAGCGAGKRSMSMRLQSSRERCRRSSRARRESGRQYSC